MSVYLCSVCQGASGSAAPWTGAPPAICWDCRDLGHRHPVLTKGRDPLPPTRSDEICGKNRYTSVESAFNALWAHASAKGHSEYSMVVVSHEKCPGKFHIVASSKAQYYSEVHDG